MRPETGTCDVRRGVLGQRPVDSLFIQSKCQVYVGYTAHLAQDLCQRWIAFAVCSGNR